MVRIPLPNRLKSSGGKAGSNGGSQNGSRNSSPMRGLSDAKHIVLRTTVIKVNGLAPLEYPVMLTSLIGKELGGERQEWLQ